MVAPKRIVRSPQWQDVNGLIPSTLELDGSTLPTASKNKTGVVQVGDGIDVSPAGEINITETKNRAEQAYRTATEASDTASDLEARLTDEEKRVPELNFIFEGGLSDIDSPTVDVRTFNTRPNSWIRDGYINVSWRFNWPRWMLGMGARLLKIESDISELKTRQPTGSPASPASIQDTGWRDVSSLIPLNGRFRIRRWGEVVELVGESFTATANVTGVVFPPGFNGQNFRSRPGDNHLTALISGNRLTIFNTLNNGSSAQGFRSTWLTVDPFPTELPGTPV